MSRAYPRIRRLIGGALATAAIVSLLVSIVAVYQIWSLRARLADGFEESLTLLSETLTTSERALENVDSQLGVAKDSLEAAERATRDVAGTMGSTRDSLRTSASMVSTELPATIVATQSAIQNTQTSARLVDDVLGALASIPFLGIDYRPQVPLNEELGNMARSLDRLPSLTVELGNQLDTTALGLDDARQGTEQLSETLRRSQAGFAESRGVIAEFRQQVGESRGMVERARQQVPGAVTWVAVGLTFVLGWLTIVQAAALVLGLEWLLTPESDQASKLR